MAWLEDPLAPHQRGSAVKQLVQSEPGEFRFPLRASRAFQLRLLRSLADPTEAHVIQRLFRPPSAGDQELDAIAHAIDALVTLCPETRQDWSSDGGMELAARPLADQWQAIELAYLLANRLPEVVSALLTFKPTPETVLLTPKKG